MRRAAPRAACTSILIAACVAACTSSPAQPPATAVANAVATAPAPAVAPTSPRNTPSREVIRITLRLDPERKAVTWRVGPTPIKDLAQFKGLLEEAVARQDGERAGRVRVVIDAQRSVPWRDVVDVVNICQECKVTDLKFDFSDG